MTLQGYGHYTRRSESASANDASIDAVFQLQQPTYPPPPPPPPPPPSSSILSPHSASFSHVGPAEPQAQPQAQPEPQPQPDAGVHDASGAGEPQVGVDGGDGGDGSARLLIPPGVDTSLADLTYRHSRRAFSANNPSPEGWLYPHKKGIGSGSNLEAFKSEIEERTRRGENCKTIADALITMGVQTSDKAISRVRIKWGMRKRAQRKVRTPPPDSEAARLSAKAKVQALRKIEITRMTKEGMTAEHICENLTSRGMELRKGVATVLRLQSAWKLTHDEKRFVENFRHQCHKQAKAEQLRAFKDIAKELDIEHVDAWLEVKMSEQASREARHQLALELMGKHAPANPERRKLQTSRKDPGRQSGDTVDNTADSDSESGADADVGATFGPPDGNDGYDQLDGQPDANMDEDDADGLDSAASVAARVFARVGQTLPQTTASPRPVSMYPAPPPARAAAMTASRRSTKASLQPGSKSSATVPVKRGRGRPPKKPITKPAPAPELKAPSAPGATHPAPPPAAPRDGMTANDPGTPSVAQDNAPTPTAATPAPMLVLRPEEAEANKTALSTLDLYHAAAETYKSMLQARTDNKPLPGSLTGLPPSANEVDLAKRKLKEATQAMMLNLE